MDDGLYLAKKAFSKIGWIFFVLSLAVSFLQSAALLPFALGGENSTNIQMLVSTGILYFTGSIVLIFSAKSLPAADIPKKKMSVIQIIKAFFMCYAAMIAANMLGIFVTTFLGLLLGEEIINPLMEVIPDMSLPVIFITTVVGAPIFEELFFRKFIIDRLLVYGEVISLMVSGFMFGLFHGNLSQFPYAFVLGAFFGYIYIRTGNIKYPIILHAMVNFMGSIVSSMLLKMADIDSIIGLLDNAVAPAAELSTALIKEIADKLDVIIIFLLYELVVVLFIVIGIILWILNAKKIYFEPKSKQLPKGTGFSVAIMNKGMIAFTVLWFITIAMAVIPF